MLKSEKVKTVNAAACAGALFMIDRSHVYNTGNTQTILIAAAFMLNIKSVVCLSVKKPGELVSFRGLPFDFIQEFLNSSLQLL